MYFAKVYGGWNISDPFVRNVVLMRNRTTKSVCIRGILYDYVFKIYRSQSPHCISCCIHKESNPVPSDIPGSSLEPLLVIHTVPKSLVFDLYIES